MGREKPKFTPCMPSLLPKLDEENENSLSQLEDDVSRVSLSPSNSSSSLSSIYEDFLLPTAHPPVPIPTSPSLSSSSSFIQPSFPISFSTPSSSIQTSSSYPRPRSHHTRSHSTNSSIIIPPSVLMSPVKNPVNNNYNNNNNNNNNNGNMLRASMEDGGGGAFTRNNNNNNNNSNNNGNNKSASAGDLLDEHGPFSKYLFLKILFPWNDRPGSVYKVRKFGPDTTVDQALSELNSNLSDGYKSIKNKLYFNGVPLEGPKELASYGFQHSDILHFKREPEYEFSAPNAKQGGHLTLDPNIVIHDVIKKILVWMFGSIPASSQDSRSSSPRYKLLKKIQAASPVMGATWGIRLMEAKKLTDYGIRKRDVLQLVIKTGSSKLNENENNNNNNNNSNSGDPPKHETIYEIDVEDAPVTADIEDDKDVKDIKEEEEVVGGKTKRRSLKRGILRRASEQNLNLNAVGTPFNVVHKSHVNFDYQWTGDNVAESFEYKEKLGQGGYGAVFKAVHKETGFTLAIKTLALNGAGRSDLQKEIDILKKCRCSNVLSYYGSAVVKNEIWILMDLCSVGSAKDLMKTCVETLDETQISMIAREVLKGLAYLHARNIIHMDVKAANILLTEDGGVKLADFGVSQQLQETSSQSDVLIGSPLWMAPEILLKNPYDHKADSWSLGITLIELAEGRAPAPRGVRKLEDLIKLTPTMPPPAFTNTRQWSPMFVDFVSKCLVKDPAARMNAVELLAHPFIGGAGGPEVIMNLIKDCLRIKAAKQEKERLRAASVL